MTTGEAVMTRGFHDEGIGNSRITDNLATATIDDAVQVDDQEMVDTVYRLLHQEGWFFGSSSA